MPETQVKNILKKIFNANPVKAIDKLEFQAIQQCLKDTQLHNIYLTMTKRFIEKISVVKRLKCWALIHMLLSSHISNSTKEQLEHLFEVHSDRLHQKSEENQLEKAEKYFQREVQRPYLLILKKLLIWKESQEISLQDPVNQGFSELNRIRQFFQFDNIIGHYKIYYPQHEQIFDIFQNCIISLKQIWGSVCIKIQKIAKSARQKGYIEENQFMLIKEAESVQDRLMEFIYSHKIALKLPTELKIKKVLLLEADIAALKKNMKRKESAELIMIKILNKKQRKSSAITVDSLNSPKKNQIKDDFLRATNLTCKTQIKQQILNSEEEGEIIDTIQQLERMVTSWE